MAHENKHSDELVVRALNMAAPTHKFIVIARYSPVGIGVFVGTIFAFCAYIIWILASDILYNPNNITPKYSFYAIGFISLLPLGIWQFSKLAYSAIVTRKPIVWVEDGYLVYFKDATFRANLDDVSASVSKGQLRRIVLSAPGQQTATLPYALDRNPDQILATINSIKLRGSTEI